MQRFQLRLRARLILFFLLIATVGVALVSLTVLNLYTRDMRQSLGERIQSIAQTAAAYIDPEPLSALQPGDENTAAYKKIREQLQEVCEKNQVTYLYTVFKQANGAVYFGVDSDPEDPAKIGDEAFITEPMKNSFTGQAAYATEFYTDEYGTFLPAAAPILAASGQIVAVLAIDYSAEKVLHMEKVLKLRMLLAAIIAEILALLIALLLARNIVRPIRTLGEVLEDMADSEGDLARRLDESRADEIGDLSRKTNQMLNAIHQMIVDIRGMVDQLQKMAVQFRQSTEKSNDHVTQIIAAFENVARGAEQQAGGTESVTAKADQIMRHLTELRQAFSDVSEKSEDSLRHVQEGTMDLERMTRQTYQVSNDIRQTMEKVHRLAQQATQVEGIITTINSIAEQTNLLALNASIEAARAGESGKGFAVVANEVSNLATQSKSSVQEIGHLLQEIRKLTEDLKVSMDGNWQLVQESTPLAQSVDDSFSKIAASMTGTRQEVKAVEPALQLLSSSGADIFAAAGSIHEIARENASVAEEAAASSDESLRSFRQMVSVTQELENVTDALHRLVGKFSL
ncbi:MAG: methyl-accepting chemotaxis protein [Peptococcaceae bacterium]|nr:methyl-accepting chemotaxis protein [Peptococcaceae bacterium]